ncbi:anti-sigma factor [Ornithinibacillus halotolerans]|uniref:Anti-sigma K factor RskA C-terminal domain-containing protein n=1 Tax=Ornithinibacillus halotolerans TaxID=1274357 RepID=A0A916RVW8_9BACI|nr:anti-sigma factor [Ornithinibacillus halotolerans]GGA73166.1 hypothetical protein GCM10008025_16140 [Ornithinibacillus halotolerans]
MKHLTEDILVDYVLGSLHSEQIKNVNKHVLICEECRERVSLWQQLTAKESELIPSKELQQRIMATIDSQPKSKKKKHQFYYIVASTAVTIFLASILVFVNQSSHDLTESKEEYITAQHNLIPEQSFLNRPETNRLDIFPVSLDKNIKGDVWLNEATNELIFQVDGLEPLTAHDYQVWLIHEDNVWKDELLQFENGRVQVYYKGPDVGTIRFIKVSVEPIGGSHTPTGPETLFIDLHQ